MPLTPSQERELAEARAGMREWVGPAVAAQQLGISTDALAKRRQNKSKDTPKWKQGGGEKAAGKTQYLWADIERIRPMRAEDLAWLRKEHERLKGELERSRQAQAATQAALRKVAEHVGLDLGGLNTLTYWATDERDRITGHAALMGLDRVAPYTWLEALEVPWIDSDARAPYAALAIGVLEQAHARALGTAKDRQE